MKQGMVAQLNMHPLKGARLVIVSSALRLGRPTAAGNNGSQSNNLAFS